MRNRERSREGIGFINSCSLCTMSACINANIASPAKCSAGRNKQHKLNAKEPRSKPCFQKINQNDINGVT